MNARHLGLVCMIGSVLASTACESRTQVGSACPSGVCPTLGTVEGLTCLLSDDVDLIANAPDLFCLPSSSPLHDDSGLSACTVEWVLPRAADASPDDPAHCSDRPFLQPTASQLGGETCIVQQLSAEEYATPGTQGWFYEHGASPECGAGGAIRFTDEARPTDAVLVLHHCSQVLAEDDEGTYSVDPSECAVPRGAGANGVGDSCDPIVPGGGFDDRQAYIETGATECETGTCLVFRLHGDPASDCAPSADVECATPADVAERVHCTCRCDTIDSHAAECECPKGFSCAPILDRSPGSSGGYCVRNAAVTPLLGGT
jgi:hypothetical protein